MERHLRQLIEQALSRLERSRKGSAEYWFIIRQLVGLRDWLELLTGDWTDRA